jgi:hypothetical protein
MDKFCKDYGFIGWFETSAKGILQIKSMRGTKHFLLRLFRELRMIQMSHM